jgi:hypothetical protein
MISFIDKFQSLMRNTIQENASSSYRLYESGFSNVSLPFVVLFEFVKTEDSSRGPILNTLENSTMSALQRQNDELLQNVPADSDCTRRGETEQVMLNEQLGRIPMHLYFE